MHQFDEADRKAKIIEDLRRLTSHIGKTPTINQFKRARRETQYSYDQIRSIFGTWTDAVSAAGLTPNPIGEPPRSRIGRDELIDEFVRVANNLGAIPSHPKFSANSPMSRGPFERTFGSWRKAVATIVEVAAGRFTFPVPDTRKPRRGGAGQKQVRLGLDIPLSNTPQNETETLVLFALLAAELGFEIESAQIAFPDLRLRKGDEMIPAEVEFLSSEYLDHGHPVDSTVLCVCWRQDRDIPGLRGVLSLEAEVRSMRKRRLEPLVPGR